MRLGVNVLRFWLGYLATIKPILRRGGLVVGDRWAYGYLVEPSALRFAGSRSVARLALRMMPQPDLVVALVVDAETIRQRKPELTVEEITRQLTAWSQLPAPMVVIDAGQPPDAVARSIVGHLIGHLAD
jgi:thymidylate kinase